MITHPELGVSSKLAVVIYMLIIRHIRTPVWKVREAYIHIMSGLLFGFSTLPVTCYEQGVH